MKQFIGMYLKHNLCLNVDLGKSRYLIFMLFPSSDVNCILAYMPIPQRLSP